MRTCVFFVVLGVAAEAACAADDGWRAQVLLESGHGMGGAAIGDLDPESPGNEVVAVNAAGEV